MGNRHKHHHRKSKGGGVNYTDNKSAAPEDADENAHAKAKKRKPVIGVEGAKAKHHLASAAGACPGTALAVPLPLSHLGSIASVELSWHVGFTPNFRCMAATQRTDASGQQETSRPLLSIPVSVRLQTTGSSVG